mgnify:CR=1 FL=1
MNCNLDIAKIEFSYRVIDKDNGKLMAEGFTIHGFVNSENFRPINIKKVNPEMYQKLLNSQND